MTNPTMDRALDAAIAEAAWVADLYAQHEKQLVDEALRYAAAFGDDPDCAWLHPNVARLIALAGEVKRLRGAA